MAPNAALHYIAQADAARCVRRHIPGALSILKGAVPDRARGLGHMAPTYFRREPGIDAPTAVAASALFSIMNSATHVEELKTALRREAAACRDALAADVRQAAAEAIAAQTFPLPIASNVIVSGFMPLKTEINPLPLMQKLAAQGARLALPRIVGRGSPLSMRAWQYGALLDRGQWGIREPRSDAPAVEPDILLVPLLAFDRAGYRIGYGAGYYDMTIARLRSLKRITAVGIAFAVQEVAEIPKTTRDERLDLVLTEREVIDLR
jgi:5-formyltetrahydrofolate cyclo-ligase